MTNDSMSSAAQAILHEFWGAPVSPTRNVQIAAALRAAADQCHFQEIREADYTTRRWICLDDILAIANELEGAND